MSTFGDIVHRRRSCRAYDPDREIPDSVLQDCIDSARAAPSACNRQPWHFTIVRDPEKRRTILEKGLLPGIQHDWLYDCPCIVALSLTPNFTVHRIAPFLSKIPYHYVDAGIAGEHFILAATEQGLGTCWVGWIREKKIRKVLHLKTAQRVVALIAAGYPRDPNFFEADTATSRKPANEIARWM